MTIKVNQTVSMTFRTVSKVLSGSFLTAVLHRLVVVTIEAVSNSFDLVDCISKLLNPVMHSSSVTQLRNTPRIIKKDDNACR